LIIYPLHFKYYFCNKIPVAAREKEGEAKGKRQKAKGIRHKFIEASSEF
jgi:hypothetical protein